MILKKDRFDMWSRFLQYVLTCPGKTVPTVGDTVNGQSSGTTNWNEVGPTGAISPTKTT